jgi:polyisoprenoid-binding protein YceI
MQTPRFRIRLLLVPLLWAAWAAPGWAVENRYEFSATDENNEIRFRSEATLEDFEGRGDRLSGWFRFDPLDLSSLRGELEFDLRSLDTGLDLRDRHMHENVLETEEFPTARFIVNTGPGGELSTGRGALEIEGTLSLHGVSKPMTALVLATPSGDGYQIEATFRVRLRNYKIKRPKMLIMKVAEEVDLSVRALARLADANTPTEQPNQKEETQ